MKTLFYLISTFFVLIFFVYLFGESEIFDCLPILQTGVLFYIAGNTE